MSGTKIELDKAIEIDGATVSTLTMREPTVEDQLQADEVKGIQGRQEVWLFANLCEVTSQDIGRLSLKDYRKLQEAYAGFTV